jgi:predicted acyl esterase
MEYHPYRRLAAPLPDCCDECPPVVPYLAERGYAVVQYDVRGTGSSSGFSTGTYSPEEGQDGRLGWMDCRAAVVQRRGRHNRQSYGGIVQW